MKISALVTRSLVAAAFGVVATSASAGVVTWTDWTSISANAASGSMGGISVSIAETSANTINGPSQTACGTNYWTGTAYTNGSVSNAPTACEMVALNSPVTITVTFGQALDNLYMGLLSIGQSTVAVTYDFDRPFTIDSQGTGFFGTGTGTPGAGDTLAMNEFHGVVRFDGPVSSLTFTTDPAENWHAFTFGTMVPEPASLALVSLGLLGLGSYRRRKA